MRLKQRVPVLIEWIDDCYDWNTFWLHGISAERVVITGRDSDSAPHDGGTFAVKFEEIKSMTLVDE